MKRFRIQRLHVLLVGLLLSAGVVVLFVFMFITPLRKTIKTTKDEIAKQQEIIDQRQPYEQQLRSAQEEKLRVDAAYDAVMHARMPTFPFKPDELASSYFMWDFAARETGLMDDWFRRTGAQVTGYSFPTWPALTPTSTLEQAALPPLTWNLSVTVRDYADLQRWLLTIPKAPRLMALQSVSIPSARGPGQPLTANVQVIVYEWLAGPGLGAVSAPAAGAPAGGPSGGSGARRGMGGGPGEGPGAMGGPGG